jgi:hypothetical protein
MIEQRLRAIPGASNGIYQTFLGYLNAGYSVVPINPETKKPTISGWKGLQARPMSLEQFKRDFAHAKGGAIITGKVSSNTEALDFDNRGEQFPLWQAAVERQAPGLIKRLGIERSQSRGFHATFRCPGMVIPGSQKLSQRAVNVTQETIKRLGELGVDRADAKAVRSVLPKIRIEIEGKSYTPIPRKDGFVAIVTLIETRGESGYIIISPTPSYSLIHGDYCKPQTITTEERKILIDSAAAITEFADFTDAEGSGYRLPKDTRRPGDDFNERGDVVPLLLETGWQPCGERGDYQHFTRPGKNKGVSASLIGGKVLKVFTSNGYPFEEGKKYAPFGVYALLKHDGDYAEAAKDLARQGYGKSEPLANLGKTGQAQDPEQDYDRLEREAIQSEEPEKPKLLGGILEINQLASIEVPERKKYLDPWLMASSINMICGPRGIGKTMFAFSIADSVASGRGFCSWAAGESVNTLYLDGELVLADLQERANYFRQEAYPSKFYVYSTHQFNLLGLPNANLSDETWQKEMTALLKYLNVKLWFIDNVASLTPGIDENLKHAWDPINQWFLQLRFAGISTVFLHHTGKEKSQRGTSGREDNIDISIMLELPKGYNKEDGCRFVTKFEKARIRQRDLHLIADTEFALVVDEYNAHTWTFANQKVANKKAVLELLDNGMSQKDIAYTLELSKGYVSKIKLQAEKDGYITPAGKLTQTGYILNYGAKK